MTREVFPGITGTPKTVTLRKEADGWYACISCAEVPVEPLAHTGEATGIDVGLKVFLIIADGGWSKVRAITARQKSKLRKPSVG